LDVSFRVRFVRPKRSEIPNQIHFKIGVRSAHDSAARHLQRLAQNTDVIPRKTDSLKLTDNLVDLAWILK
jgi:hypothetical protein